jgi:glycosyltransferase involved in cell wall biosynthesis
MKILLLGEYSGLHNNLKKGLLALGHEVTLINNGDAFKNYPTDISIKASFVKSLFFIKFRHLFYRIFKIDLALLEHGIRFWWHLPKLKKYDVIQFINEWPIQAPRKLEYILLQKLFKKNKANFFLLTTGVDSYQVQYMLQDTLPYSIMTPYLDNPTKYKIPYLHFLDYLSPKQQKITQLIYQNIKGIVATDFDYIPAAKKLDKYAGHIPYPIDNSVPNLENKVHDKIVILLGINTGNALNKGIVFFEKALKIIEKKYEAKVNIQIVKNLPYQQYRKHYHKAHILLDQVYGYDQGYNALEAMLHKKVVFTGAEKEFLAFYQLQEDTVCINALPNVDYLVEKLGFLIENPEKITEIGKNAREFVLQFHDSKKIAQKYLATWMS